jgi:hypothetical protein
MGLACTTSKDKDINEQDIQNQIEQNKLTDQKTKNNIHTLNNSESNTTADSNNNNNESYPLQKNVNCDVQFFEVQETNVETFLTTLPEKSNNITNKTNDSPSKTKADQFNIHLNFYLSNISKFVSQSDIWEMKKFIGK